MRYACSRKDTLPFSEMDEIEQKKRVVVGMNEFKVEENLDTALFKPDPEQARRQLSKLQTVRKSRDGAKCGQALDSLRRAAEGQENLMPYFIEAVKAYATLGEICRVLRKVFGEYRQFQTL